MGTFYACTNLQTIKIPYLAFIFGGINSITGTATLHFFGCSSLQGLYMGYADPADVYIHTSTTFEGSPLVGYGTSNGNPQGYIYVPSKYYASYRAMTNLNAVRARIRSSNWKG